MNQEEILTSLKSYDPNCDESQIQKAVNFAVRYHGTQIRESGEPYYYHPLHVAEIVLQMRLDSKSVITAILHDTIEDTDLTLEDITHHFGAEIAKLVSGVTKLTKIEFFSEKNKQAENFRKLLLAMSEDIRVLLVKLADRLHNMRTIDFVKSTEKRHRIALETMEIYAPLAERIGIQQIKTELQDICFKVLQPQIRQSILNRLYSIVSEDSPLIEKVIFEIQNELQNANIVAQVLGRKKTPYSIWMKIKQKNVSIDQLSDIIAFRIIVDSVQSCYQALGVIHTKYQMIPDHFQDFISTPKNNGYQSLHTIVMGPFSHKIEIQIRTQEMNDIAELGVAAHWRYKQKHYDVAYGKQYQWIQELLSILDQANDSEDFLKNTKLAMYYDQVFCFTPKGHLIALPKGATTIDFAYAVHSNLGNHCVGAKVNGRIVPLRTVLNNGDQIEILASKNQYPSPSWEKFVITGKARSEIRKFIYTQQKEQYFKLGQSIIENTLSFYNVTNFTPYLNEACSVFKKKNVEDLFISIGSGVLNHTEVINKIHPRVHSKLSSWYPFKRLSKLKKTHHQAYNEFLSSSAVPINELISGMAIHFCQCCHPMPGDKIIGVIDPGKGAIVHTADCETLDIAKKSPETLINLIWSKDQSNIPFICRLKVTVTNNPGSFATIGTCIAIKEVNIINFKLLSRSTDFFEILLDLEVVNLEQLEDVMFNLKSQACVSSVERLKK